jgi:diguanylate cyclase (GGDEF)-like protein
VIRPEARAARVENESVAPSRVLLVEDSPADALLTMEHLRRAAPWMVCTHIDRLSLATPELLAANDCVILDLSLPDAHGLDALLNARHRDADIPILVLTGLADMETGVEALRHGAQDYVLKNSVDGPGLERAIRYAVERKSAQDALARAALRDPLTGLLNRSGFLDRLNHALLRRARVATTNAVLFFDLDHFKSVNDSLGHLAGDDLLRQVAERLVPHLRPQDTLARLGGDEFTALLEDLLDPVQAETVAERLLEAFVEPFWVDGEGLHISASIGLTIATPTATAEDMLRDADTAMYAAKDAGRGRVASFSQDLHDRAVEILRVEGELREALAWGELLLAYQPLVDTRTREPLYLEALSRWSHPSRGMLGPDAFLDVAERSGTVERVDFRALVEAIAWLAAEPAPPAVAVNLSGRTLAIPELAPQVSRLLMDVEVSAERLWLEVTEGALLDDHAVGNIRELRELGIRIALDDFGTGYSRLDYLTRQRIDLIKIDKSFLPDDADDVSSIALLQAIAQLGHAVGIPVAVEGVETEQQLELAGRLGIDYVQGFLVGEPAVRVVPLPEPRPDAS